MQAVNIYFQEVPKLTELGEGILGGFSVVRSDLVPLSSLQNQLAILLALTLLCQTSSSLISAWKIQYILLRLKKLRQTRINSDSQ